MIEIICNDDRNSFTDREKSSPDKKGEPIKRPKNIKQFGEINQDKKIYIEDYAFTYANSIAYSNPTESQAGVLLGEFQTNSEEKCVFIKGVIKARYDQDNREGEIFFNERIWNGIYSDVEKYFPNLAIVGWFAAIPEITPQRMMKLKKIHLDNFAGTMKAFYLIDTVEKEENFFLYEQGELKKQKGYVCFYERNCEMQEYMLERREGKSTEDGQDRVMKSIRNIIREKEETREQQRSTRFMYAVSAVMVVVILAISINLMNNYKKLKKFDKSLSNIMVHMSGEGSESQNVIAVNKNYEKTVSSEDSSPAETKAEEKTEAETTSVSPVYSSENVTVSVEEIKPATDYIYTVKPGDSMMGICKKYYGDTKKCEEVISYNNIADANYLYVGQQIKLP